MLEFEINAVYKYVYIQDDKYTIQKVFIFKLKAVAKMSKNTDKFTNFNIQNHLNFDI